MYAQAQMKSLMRVESADHVMHITDQMLSEGHASTLAQMPPTSTFETVNARSAQDTSELTPLEEAASEINAMLDNSSTIEVSAKTARFALEHSQAMSNVQPTSAAPVKSSPLKVPAKIALRTPDPQL
jgi:hypothetical protein